MAEQNPEAKFAICIKSDDPDVLTPRMIYEVLPDQSAAKSNYIRVIDNEGEDYLYPADYFMFVSFPQAVEKTLSRISLPVIQVPIANGCIDASPRENEVLKVTENEVGTIVIECAIEVHRQLGPGLLESVYEVVLAREQLVRGLNSERQVPVPIQYKDMRFDEGFRADIIVEGKVILELKSVERVTGAHKKQVQTYLRLTGLKLGYLLNFGETTMKAGITRCVNGLVEV